MLQEIPKTHPLAHFGRQVMCAALVGFEKEMQIVV